MKYLPGTFVVFLLTAVFFAVACPAKLAAEDRVHVVEKGETVFSISRLYGIGQEELMKYNNISDASKLQTGKRLNIPPAVSAGAPAFTEYLVVKGDTLYSLARVNGITEQAIREINGFAANYGLREGQRIKMPLAQGAAGTRTAQSVPAQPTSVRPVQLPSEPRQTVQRAVDTSLRWPVLPKEIAYMTGKLQGVVVQGERLEAVKSLTQGTVISAGPYRGFGRVAIVQAAGGYLYVYGGCESLSVKEGDRIGPGAELGKLGVDAVSEKPQLFFMVYQSNKAIDPAKAPRA